MDDNRWEPKRRIELQFQHSLDKIGERMLESIEGLTDPFEITTVIKTWLHNMTFHHFADTTAENLVRSVLKSSSTTWRMAARENTNGRIIHEALRKELQGHIGVAVASQVNRNAEIIKSMPLDVARQLTNYINAEAMKGRRANDIVSDILAKFPDITKKKATLIARTETSKTSTALTQARCEDIGLSWYRWRTSEDGRVRDSHKLMDGVLVKWTNPPSPEKLFGEKKPPAPYHAGDIYNCRCYPEPVVNLNNLEFPVKVYWNGTITRMTRSQFEQIAA